MSLPLEGITILEFSQYLSGPCAGLRLADLGARVIKIERVSGGDSCRQLVINQMWADDSSLLFHTINRNKESFAANLKNPDDLLWIHRLLKMADVLTHNFRPGVMESLLLDYPSVKKINSRLIYLEISGYGKTGPWQKKPGQDLLVQALSGLCFASGNQHNTPIPFGLAIEDYLCGNQAVQAILAALVRREKTGNGALLSLSLLESAIDFQFEFFTTFFQTRQQHVRSKVSNAHALLSAPYGLYETADKYIAVAMMPLSKLNAAIACEALLPFDDTDAFLKRDEIKKILSDHFRTAPAAEWISKMQQQGLWVMPVLDWSELRQTSTYQSLNMEQSFKAGHKNISTTRCPVRINGQYLYGSKPAPSLGEHTEKIKEEWNRQHK